jgi:hypothetical protein
MDATPTQTPTLEQAHNAQPGTNERELIEPRVAAVKLLRDFRKLAREMAPDDWSTQDDLVQEMALAALKLRKPQRRMAYINLGYWHALDYLKWWYGPSFREILEMDKTAAPWPRKEWDVCEEAKSIAARLRQKEAAASNAG